MYGRFIVVIHARLLSIRQSRATELIITLSVAVLAPFPLLLGILRISLILRNHVTQSYFPGWWTNRVLFLSELRDVKVNVKNDETIHLMIEG